MKAAKSGEEKYLLVIVCEFTGFVVSYPMFKANSIEVASRLINFMTHFGVPESVRSDNGTEFINDLVDRLHTFFHVHNIVITPYYHQANGQAERMIRTVKENIAKLSENYRIPWTAVYDVANMCINHSAASRTGVSPFYAVFGRHPPFFGNMARIVEKRLEDMPTNMRNTTLCQSTTWADVLSLHHGRILPELFRTMVEKKEKQSEQFNEENLSSKVRQDCMVYVIDERRTSKTEPKFKGPYRVSNMDEFSNCMLVTPYGVRAVRRYAANRLKVVSPSDVDPQVRDILDYGRANHKDWFYVVYKNYEDSEGKWTVEEELSKKLANEKNRIMADVRNGRLTPRKLTARDFDVSSEAYEDDSDSDDSDQEEIDRMDYHNL